jgi:hypothetical protein
LKKLPFKKMLWILTFGGLTSLLVIQLVPVDRANPPVDSDIAAPSGVSSLLRKSCYDCHSNETVWPWYSKVAPISWLLAADVNEGREELNFSRWGDYGGDQRMKILKEIWEEVSEGEMPPSNYVLLHKDAALSAEERELLHEWSLDSRPK